MSIPLCCVFVSQAVEAVSEKKIKQSQATGVKVKRLQSIRAREADKEDQRVEAYHASKDQEALRRKKMAKKARYRGHPSSTPLQDPRLKPINNRGVFAKPS